MWPDSTPGFPPPVARTDPCSLAIVYRLLISGEPVYPKVWGERLKEKLKREANSQVRKVSLPS